MSRKIRRHNFMVFSLQFKTVGMTLVPIALIALLLLLFSGEVAGVLFDGKVGQKANDNVKIDSPQGFGDQNSNGTEGVSSSEKGKILPLVSVSLAPKAENGYVSNERVYLRNHTKFDVDLKSIMESPLNLLGRKKEGPQVLVIHTHGSESYSEKNAATYNSNQSDRNTDINQNVVAVGSTFAKTLTELGIETVHDTTMYDRPDFNTAYTKSGEGAQKWLDKYPSIRVIVDVHRDSIVTSEGIKYRPVVDIGGKSAAQVMLVVGTPQNGLSHKNWRDNLNFAAHWAKLLEESNPGITRPIDLSKDRYNQQLRTGAVILEVGSSGNCLDEAIESAKICAKSLSKLLTDNN
ncbi:MAG: stage II sporulation protein P [Bacillota bacterium]|nr:stage II sporulation protein P [Bacillota bacterium]